MKRYSISSRNGRQTLRSTSGSHGSSGSGGGSGKRPGTPHAEPLRAARGMPRWEPLCEDEDEDDTEEDDEETMRDTDDEEGEAYLDGLQGAFPATAASGGGGQTDEDEFDTLMAALHAQGATDMIDHAWQARQTGDSDALAAIATVVALEAEDAKKIRMRQQQLMQEHFERQQRGGKKLLESAYKWKATERPAAGHDGHAADDEGDEEEEAAAAGGPRRRGRGTPGFFSGVDPDGLPLEDKGGDGEHRGLRARFLRSEDKARMRYLLQMDPDTLHPKDRHSLDAVKRALVQQRQREVEMGKRKRQRDEKWWGQRPRQDGSDDDNYHPRHHGRRGLGYGDYHPHHHNHHELQHRHRQQQQMRWRHPQQQHQQMRGRDRRQYGGGCRAYGDRSESPPAPWLHRAAGYGGMGVIQQALRRAVAAAAEEEEAARGPGQGAGAGQRRKGQGGKGAMVSARAAGAAAAVAAMRGQGGGDEPPPGDAEARVLNGLRAAPQGRLALHVAAEGGQAAAASFLMSRGARADIPDEASGLLPLHLAAVEGHIPTMEVLLGLPPSPPVVPRRFDAIVPPSPYLAPAARTATGVTPLHLAALNNRPAAVTLLLAHHRAQRRRQHQQQPGSATAEEQGDGMEGVTPAGPASGPAAPAAAAAAEDEEAAGAGVSAMDMDAPSAAAPPAATAAQAGAVEAVEEENDDDDGGQWMSALVDAPMEGPRVGGYAGFRPLHMAVIGASLESVRVLLVEGGANPLLGPPLAPDFWEQPEKQQQQDDEEEGEQEQQLAAPVPAAAAAMEEGEDDSEEARLAFMRDNLQDEDRAFFEAALRITRGGLFVGGGDGGGEDDESGEEEDDEDEEGQQDGEGAPIEQEPEEEQGCDDAVRAATIVTPRVLAIRLNRDPAIVRLLEAAEREPERVQGLLRLRAAAAANNNAGGTITEDGEDGGEGQLRACLRFATGLGLERGKGMPPAAFGALLRLLGPPWALGVEEEGAEAAEAEAE